MIYSAAPLATAFVSSKTRFLTAGVLVLFRRFFLKDLSADAVADREFQKVQLALTARSVLSTG